MNWLRTFWVGFSALFRKRKLDAEMDEELRSHLEMQTQANLDGGMEPEQARRSAQREFGWAESIKETCRDQRGIMWVENVARDLRFGARMLCKKPGFTSVAVLTLALGIGATTAIFSVINGVLLKPLPYEHSGQLVNVWEHESYSVGPGVFLDWKENSKSFEGLSVVNRVAENLTGGGDPVRLLGWSVSANFLELLRVRPLLGRGFLPGEDNPKRENKVLILTEALWKSQFGADSHVLGRTVNLSAETYTVVGVLPAKALFSAEPQFLIPHVIAPGLRGVRGESEFRVIGRLKPGTSIKKAGAELWGIKQNLKALYPKFKADWHSFLVPMHEGITADVKPKLLLLFGAVFCLLLIACTNVAGLMLAKASVRLKELSIRASLGATRWRIIQQVLAESLLLGLMGGVLGLLVGWCSLQTISQLGNGLVPLAGQIRLDASTLLFSIMLALGTSVFFGLLPGLGVSRPDLNRALKENSATTTGGSPRFLRRGLVISQIGLATVLLVLSGLFLQSFARLLRVNTGFEPQRALVMEVSLPTSKYPNELRRGAFLRQVCQQLESLPGVMAAGTAPSLPLSPEVQAGPLLTVDGRKNQPEPGYFAVFDQIQGNYFSALGIPILRGRGFTEYDYHTNSPCVCLFNEQLAREVFPNQDPIGKRIRFWGKDYEIVGLTGTISNSLQQEKPYGHVYFANLEVDEDTHRIFVRTKVDPFAMAGAIRKEILRMDPAQPVGNIRTMSYVVTHSISDRRLVLELLGLFAGLALLLTGLGVYGVMAFETTRRTNEIGVRMALGARRKDVLTLILASAARLALIGVILGTGAALASIRILKNQVYEFKAADPVVFALGSFIVLVVALLACWFPAKRAAGADPMAALRCE